MKKHLHLHKGTAKPTTTTTTTTPTTTVNTAEMYAMEKRIKKELKAQQKKASSAPAETKEIEPPRLHRDMRLICDVFRISEPSRYALRSFDAATLEDFSLMLDEDFADLILYQARIGTPVPPLQQRKLSVLRSWVRSIATAENVEVSETVSSSSNKAEGFDLNESNEGNDDTTPKVGFKSSARKRGGTFIPADWEEKFYADLPRLRKELQQLGGNGTRSHWAHDILSLRWIFSHGDVRCRRMVCHG